MNTNKSHIIINDTETKKYTYDNTKYKYNYVYEIIRTNYPEVDPHKPYLYIGVRSTNIEPEFDIEYMGSSNELKSDIWLYGIENFKKTIWSIYDNRFEAIITESHLQYIVEASTNDRYYNKHIQTINGFDTTGNDEVAKKISEGRKGEKNHMFGKTHSEETKQKMRKPKSEETKQKMRKPKSEETKKKMSKLRSGENNHMFGKTHSEETKKKISKTAKNKPKKICPHCGIEIDAGNYAKHHGDKCKLNQNNIKAENE